MIASSAIFLPYESYAATSEKSTTLALNAGEPQIRVQIGGQRRRGRNWNRGNRGRHRGWNNHRRTRVVRQVYWRNGRQYVRYVRVRA